MTRAIIHVYTRTNASQYRRNLPLLVKNTRACTFRVRSSLRLKSVSLERQNGQAELEKNKKDTAWKLNPLAGRNTFRKVFEVKIGTKLKPLLQFQTGCSI